MGSLYLRTNRMDLREFTVEDAENLFALDSDPGALATSYYFFIVPGDADDRRYLGVLPRIAQFVVIP